MTRLSTLVAGSIALLTLSITSAPAQQAPTSQTPDFKTGAEPCEVVPGDDAVATPLENGEQNTSSEADSSLSATLDRCGGVLSPPAVGDPEMVEPAPDAGVTPIIPPSAVPEDE
ncbi:hypothetical protein [Aquibium sp. ELW1220]|jgi:hypothetical protein|uniref:hypothetical protein n=1 Tax=Aquibium sp. ELW1220 TaxID=2976766 RepID=UPI0025B1AF31|nr:hypothetical protein [Aquibium sp. ELW1220]MDN2578511.1 hypothetical protein [Aquibium sp. ELW1220]